MRSIFANDETIKSLKSGDFAFAETSRLAVLLPGDKQHKFVMKSLTSKETQGDILYV